MCYLARVFQAVCIVVVSMTMTCPSTDAVDVPFKMLMAVQNRFCPTFEICSVNSTANELTANDTEWTVLNKTFAGFPLQLPQYRDSACCKECSCDAETCVLPGKCCLDTLDYLPSVEESRAKLRMTCGDPQLRPRRTNVWGNAGYAVTTMATCRYRDMDPLQIEMCENYDKNTDIYSQLIVVDNTTRVAYRNKYCALCNGVPEARLVYWKLKISCRRGSFQPSGLATIVQDIQQTEGCNLIYEVPSLAGYTNPDCRILIRECNQTGNWDFYDANIEAACHAYTRMYDYKYRNVFCYLCNNPVTAEPKRGCMDSHQPGLFVSFSALLRLPDTPEVVDGEAAHACTEQQIYDEAMETCLDIQCTFPYTLENGTCVSLVETFTGVMYDLFLEFTPIDAANESLTDSLIGIYLQQTVLSWLNQIGVEEADLEQFAIYFKGNGTSTSSDDGIEYMVIYLTAVYEKLGLINPRVISDVLSIDNTTVDVPIPINEKTVQFKVKVSHWHSFTSETLLLDTRTNVPLYGMPYPPIVDVHQRNGYIPDTLERLTKFHTCPSVTLSQEKLTIQTTVHGYYIAEYDSLVSFDDALVLEETPTTRSSYNESDITICLDTYLAMTEDVRDAHGNQVTPGPQSGDGAPSTIAIVSFVCTAVSVVFSILTFIGYLLFKDLRTQPGVNNMALTLYLIAVQVLFQLGIGQAGSISDTACTIVGICIHYSWLLLLMWMHTCTLHMFRVFHNKPIAAHFNVCKTTAIYTLFCWTIASIPVIVNIVISGVKTNWAQIGYGGEYCYVTGSDVYVFIVSVPVGVIVCVNVILYIMVVIHISRTAIKSSSRSADDRNHISIYMKLSTITGSTWLFGFLYMFTGVTWLEYVYVICNTTQGLFLFLAFMVNARVLGLLKKLLFKGAHETIRSTSNSPKMTSTLHFQNSPATKRHAIGQ